MPRPSLPLATRWPGDLSRYDAAGRVADAVDRAHVALKAELLAAFRVAPQSVVSTSGWGKGRHTAAEVWADHMAGADANADEYEAILILAALAGEGTGGLSTRAAALLDKIATKHADYHCDDVAQEWAEDWAEAA
jgi:hypothetical protein